MAYYVALLLVVAWSKRRSSIIGIWWLCRSHILLSGHGDMSRCVRGKCNQLSHGCIMSVGWFNPHLPGKRINNIIIYPARYDVHVIYQLRLNIYIYYCLHTHSYTHSYVPMELVQIIPPDKHAIPRPYHHALAMTSPLLVRNKWIYYQNAFHAFKHTMMPTPNVWNCKRKVCHRSSSQVLGLWHVTLVCRQWHSSC